MGMCGEDETTQLRGISLIRPMFYSTTDHNELRIATCRPVAIRYLASLFIDFGTHAF